MSTEQSDSPKVLVANRGEIALRILRACKELDLETVAVYSTADRNSPHVNMANEAVCIGPADSKGSYLNVQNIIAAAEITGANLIHPGYGFLAESADFVEVLRECKIGFVGPDSHVISKMGNKSEARRMMKASGVPVVPGSEGVTPSAREGLKVAHECGFPVMIKAVAGGGGKGMRMAESESEFSSLFQIASAEAAAAFGNGDLYVEKYVEEPRHIEVQVLADHHGNVIHLGERNCSIQRRHQKLIEEAPSPCIPKELRDQICEAAVQAARSLGYKNAGTVEFLVDKNNQFYFMEVNTRLQVEHPVTEMITGVDIVKEQLKIAQGGVLAIQQEDVEFRGHSIEFRVNAEDPECGFIPSPGKIDQLMYPGGPGIRIDSMVSAGDEILPFYDSMIAKLIIHDKSRDEAIRRSIRALEEFQLVGVKSTIPLHLQIVQSDTFRKGYFTTRFLDETMSL